jgi:phosphatidylglycerophosphate synthase
MNLHRVEGQADWQKVSPPKWNSWQKAAARSGGVITIGNFFSLLGLLSVPLGLIIIVRDHHYISGVIILALGRLCDMIDGWLADKTGTKSPLGEKVDATFDKASTGLAVAVLAVSGILPWWALALLILPHLVISALALTVLRRGKVIHPSRAGKLSMAAGWLSLLVFVAAEGVNGGVPGTALVLLAYILLGVSVLMSIAALIGYDRDFADLMKKN